MDVTLIARVKSSTQIERSDSIDMMMKVHLLSSIIKHESFKEEREWRLVGMMNYETSINACECIGGKPRVKAMLFDKEHPLRSYLREIVVSPHGNGDQLMMKARTKDGSPISGMRNPSLRRIAMKEENEQT